MTALPTAYFALLLSTTTAFTFVVLLASFSMVSKPPEHIRHRRSYALLLAARWVSGGILLAMALLCLFPSPALFQLVVSHSVPLGLLMLGPALVTAILSIRLLVATVNYQIEMRNRWL